MLRLLSARTVLAAVILCAASFWGSAYFMMGDGQQDTTQTANRVPPPPDKKPRKVTQPPAAPSGRQADKAPAPVVARVQQGAAAPVERARQPVPQIPQGTLQHPQPGGGSEIKVAIPAFDSNDEKLPDVGSRSGQPADPDLVGNLIEKTNNEQVTHLQQDVQPQGNSGAIPLPTVSPNRLTLEKKIAQMLVVGFKGTKPGQRWPTRVRSQIINDELGGIIFLKYNLEERGDAQRLMGSFLRAGEKAQHPPFIMLDQEGGAVQRLGPRVKVRKFPRPRTVAERGPEAAEQIYDDMANTLAEWGFNVNLGPVVDLDINPKSPAIGKFGRSYSRDPNTVVEFAERFIDAHKRYGILTALKHFPGHGSSKGDSHIGFTDVSKTWSEAELEPFKRIIDHDKADMVMVAHVYLDRYDDKKNDGVAHPASLSRSVITGLLREKLGYKGVVISDDMEMGAIRKHYNPRQALIDAIMAGTDVLVLSNSAEPSMELPIKLTDYIAQAARNDEALLARIEESYTRIVELKKNLRRATSNRLVPKGAEKSPDKKGLNNSVPVAGFRQYAATSDRSPRKGPTLVSPANIGAGHYVIQETR